MFYLIDNPFKGKVPDDKVKRYWDMFGTKSSMKAAAAGFPDFFVYKICKDYLFDQDMEIQCVKGDGNCLPTSVIKTLDFNQDPGSDQMYTQIYLRRAVVMHLISMWEILGADITENIKYSYGCPDSEVGGLKIKKFTGKGQNRKETYGFLVKDWCQYILRDKSWCEEIFIKLISSMWGCRISVLRADNLRVITYRYEGSDNQAEITLMYNGNPARGHYSPIRRMWKDLQYDANQIEPITFSPNYKMEVDLDEHLNQRDYIWDLDDEKMQKRIFSKRRGYMFRLPVKGKDKSKVIEEKRGTEVGEDEVIMKTKEVEAMKSAITELEKVQKRMAEIEEKRGTEVGEDEVIMKKKEVEAMKSAIAQFERVSTDESGDAKMVVMNKKQMLIGIDHYNQMRKKSKEVREDEVVMKKDEVEEKDKRIAELEKCASITDEEVIVNKEELEYMKKQIADFEQVSSGECVDGKMVVMNNDSMIIKIDHFNDMKKRCIELENTVKELSGEQGVLVREKSLKVLEAEIEHVRKNVALIAEGREVDERAVDETNTPWKRRSSQGDQPPSKSMARTVAKKNLEMQKEMPEEIEGYDKGDTYCKICKSEEHTHYQLVKHYHKYHENKAPFVCNKCRKGFFRAEGHRRHMECHSEEKKMKCTIKECSQLFTSRLAIKAHLKLKHSGVKDRIKCKFADKGCEKTFTVKGNMVEHTFKCKFNPDGIQEMKCEVCGKGGFFMPKRILQHKRKAHGWDF